MRSTSDLSSSRLRLDGQCEARKKPLYALNEEKPKRLFEETTEKFYYY